jgi:beta-lactamase regulating signal transducer with metallopeptidase domain
VADAANIPVAQLPVQDYRSGSDEASVSSHITATRLHVQPAVETSLRSSAVIHLAGTVLCAAWLAGFLASMAWIARGVLAVRGLTRSLSPVTSPRVLSMVEESSLVYTPLSLGLARKRIVLPAGLDAELDDDQLRSVLLHEMAHLVRHDHWVGLAQRLAIACFWWNPLVHRVTSQLCELREQICDDIATAPLATGLVCQASRRSASTGR